MTSKSKSQNISDTPLANAPAPGKFASIMQKTKKPKTKPVDHNMVFVSYLMEKEMSDHLEGRQPIDQAAHKIPNLP